MGNPIDRGAWWATVHGIPRVGHDLVTKQQQQLHFIQVILLIAFSICFYQYFFKKGKKRKINPAKGAYN